MAYRIERSRDITEQLEVVDLDGNVRTFDCILSMDTILKEYKSLNEKLTTLLSDDVKEITEEYYQKIGTILIEVLVLIFDTRQAHDLLTIYEGKYIELLYAILPFFKDVVKPSIDKLNEERINKYKNIDETL